MALRRSSSNNVCSRFVLLVFMLLGISLTGCKTMMRQMLGQPEQSPECKQLQAAMASTEKAAEPLVGITSLDQTTAKVVAPLDKAIQNLKSLALADVKLRDYRNSFIAKLEYFRLVRKDLAPVLEVDKAVQKYCIDAQKRRSKKLW